MIKSWALVLISLYCVLLAWSGVANAQKKTYTIAVLADLGVSQSAFMERQYIEELKILTQNEFDLTILEFDMDWKGDGFNQQLNEIYRDPRVDMLLVLGFAANQITIVRDSFPKPTFLPFVVEADLIGAPLRTGASGKKNLSYLTFSTEFVDSLNLLGEVVEFSNLAIIADELVYRALPSELRNRLLTQADGVKAQLIAHDGSDKNLLAKLDPDIDAVMVGHLPRLSDQQHQVLIDELIALKIPSFTYLGDGLVERGLLASPINRSFLLYAARRNALNMQAVMLGERASEQPVMVDIRPKMTINMATAERLGVAIDFKTLVNSDLIGFGENERRDTFNLLSVVARALEYNLEIQDEGYNLAIQDSERGIATGQLRPQLDLQASALQRKDETFAVSNGILPEKSTDASINLSQVVFSDSAFANRKIQSLLYDASNEAYRQAQLDIIRQASLAMADVLQAKAEANIQQENLTFAEKNLDLALDRVKYGATSSADQYRWETQVANGKSAVFNAFTQQITSGQALARILNLPVDKPLALEPLDINENTIFTSDELLQLLDNLDSFESIYQFGLGEAFEDSPEIKQLEWITAAKKRELKTLSRSHWLPDVSLSGAVTENIDQQGVQMNAGGERDWNVILSARIPFFQGGQLSSRRSKAELELAQLDNQLQQTKLQISQQLRANMNNMLSSLYNLGFSETAAVAARRSLELVTDSYVSGAVSITDLLDAQNASVNANLAEVQAKIGYFRSSIEMQRVIGEYEFLLTEQQKQEVRQRFISALKSKPTDRN